jgi:hypothetical protein
VIVSDHSDPRDLRLYILLFELAVFSHEKSQFHQNFAESSLKFLIFMICARANTFAQQATRQIIALLLNLEGGPRSW